MTEAAESEPIAPSPTLGECYPELADGLRGQLSFLDVQLARVSSEWHEIVDSLASVAIERATRPYSALVPTLDVWASLYIADETALDRISVVPLANRSRNVLQRNHLETWSDVGRVSPAIVGGFINAGSKVVRDTTRLAIELGAAAVVGLGDRPPSLIPLPPVPVGETPTAQPMSFLSDEPIQQLASWGLTQQGAKTLGDVFDLATDAGGVPGDIAGALCALRGLPLESLARSHPLSVAELIAELLAELSDVESMILRQRVFTASPSTLERVGIDLGVTRERVRQIQLRAEGRLEARLGTSKFAPLKWIAFAIRSSLGTLAPTSVGEAEFARWCTEVSPDDTVVALTILRRDAGPYRVERDAYITDRAHEIENRLSAAADTYGIVARDSIDSALFESGVRPEFFDAAVSWVEHFKRFGDVLVVWPNNGVAKLVAMLALRGRPTDTETLVQDAGEEYSARALHNRLGEDPRVVRVSRREWGLVEWGLEEYSSIAEEIAERVERGGGRARLVDVITEVAQFGVRESSVRMYAEAPMFVIEGEWIRLRGEDERVRADDPFAEARRTYRINGGYIAYVADVDYDVLRGSGRSLPRGTAVALGVQPGEKVTFSGDDGDVVVSWPLTSMMGPSIGSLRSHALRHDLAEGDQLRVNFDVAAMRVTSVGVSAIKVEAMTPAERVTAVTGIEGLLAGDPTTAIALAVEATSSTLRRSLIARGDDDLLQLLPSAAPNAELDNALESLARVLGGSS